MGEGATILVTGAAGFIGRRQCAFLRAQGYAVRAVDKVEDFDGETLDLAEAGAAREAVKGADAVIHLAAMTGVPGSFDEPALCHRDTADSTLNVLTAALEYGVARLVFASSAAVYGDKLDGAAREDAEPSPGSPYAQAKLQAEKHVAAFAGRGVDGVSLRYFNVYGAGQQPGSAYAGVITKFAAALHEGSPMFLFGDGGQTRDFIHASDVVTANMAALTCRRELGGMPINIGTGRSVTIRQLGAMMAELAGRTPEFESRRERRGEVRHSCADVARAREILGFEAQVRLEDGLREVMENNG